MENIAVSVGKLQGDEERTRTKKILTGVSQVVRADKIAEELDDYVKQLLWYLDSLMVCYDGRANGRTRGLRRSQVSMSLLVYIAVDVSLCRS